MTALDARSLTLKIGDGNDPEHFTEIGGLQNHRITLRNDAASYHHAALTHAWQEAHANTQRQQLSISGQGIFTDSASEEILRAQAFSNNHRNFFIGLGNGDSLQGAFTISNYERYAAMEGAINYQLTLQSAGEISFTASS